MAANTYERPVRRYAKQFSANGASKGPAKREVEGEFRPLDESLPVVQKSSSFPYAKPPPIALVPIDPDGKPWDRLRGETSRWYARFDVYRSLGPNRSMGAAYKAWHAAENIAHPDTAPKMRATYNGVNAPDTVWRVATRWRWTERAEAWDSYQIELARQMEQVRIAAANADRVNTGKTMRNLGIRAITAMDARTIKPLEAVALVKAGDDLIAKGLGLDLKENQAERDTIHVKVLDLSDDEEFEMPSSHAMLGPGPDPDDEDGETE